MNVTRDVILDLLPVYLAGDASAATRALVEEYLARDTELAERVRRERETSFDGIADAVPAPPVEVELRSLRRTRRLLALQRWLFGLGWFFFAISLSAEFSFSGGHLTSYHLLLRDYPAQLGACLALAVVCWVAYFAIRLSSPLARPRGDARRR